MVVHFVGEPNSPYYKSDTFMNMLRTIAAQADRFVLKQHNNRLAMTVRRVSDVAQAVAVLRSL
jgi:transcription-repair coupling factor (superfamily II helicase)